MKRQLIALLVTGTVLASVLASGAASADPGRRRAHPVVPNPQVAETPASTCLLTVPARPFTAAGLATPYILSPVDATSTCDETNVNASAFVQAAILSPSGQIGIYAPLVINAGTFPAAAPVVPPVPVGAVVGIWFGSNGTYLHLVGPGASSCVNGIGASDFGQYAYCGADRFFDAANRAIRAGTLVVPPLGVDSTGQACPTVRSFGIVDQDQSDNVQTHYLQTPSGQIAQDTAANIAGLPGATVIKNPSDNALLSIIVDPVIGCAPWKAPDVTNGGATMVPALALDELQAAAEQGGPVALVPLFDEMTLVNDHESFFKVAAYRLGVDQPLAGLETDAYYCSNLASFGAPWLASHEALFAAAPSPFPDVANNLFTWMAQRFVGTYETLGYQPCQNVTGTPDPVAVQTLVVGATIGGSSSAPAVVPVPPTAAPTTTAAPPTTAPSTTTTAAPAPTSSTTSTTAAPTTTTTTGY